MRKSPWIYVGPDRSDPDKILKKRAAHIHENYSLFKLYLTRFAWGGTGVDDRARHKIVAWGNSVARDCVTDASSLDVEPERYFRNLLQQLPDWIVPVLVSVAVNNKATRDLLPGLDVGSLAISSNDKIMQVLSSLLKETDRPALPPDEIALFVRLRDGALDRAWTRWLAAEEKNRDTRLADLARAIKNFPKEGRSARVKKILSNAGIPEPIFANLKSKSTDSIQQASAEKILVASSGIAFPIAQKNQTQISKIRNTTPHNTIPVLMRHIWPKAGQDIASGQFDADSIREFLKISSKTKRLLGWANRALISAVSRLEQLPKSSISKLESAIPEELQTPGFLALRIVAAGQGGALEQLRLLSKTQRANAINVLRPSVRTQICKFALVSLDPDWKNRRPEKQTPFAGMLGLAFHELPSALLPTLLARWRRIGAGSWRRNVIARLTNLRSDELLEFVKSSHLLDKYWTKLPIVVREALLESWIRNRQATPELPKVSAEMCPSFAMDAVRWGNDPEALADIILGKACDRALTFLRRSGGRNDHPGWQMALQRMLQSGEIPKLLIEKAGRDPDLLDDLIRGAMPVFKKAPLKGLNPSVLFEPAMRWNWFAKRIDNEFSREQIRKAIPAARKRLAAKPRYLAAAELAGLIGMRHAMFLAYLSTRQFPDRSKPGTRFDSFYRSWTLPKRNGGKRLITSPGPWLKAIQRSLLDHVLQTAPCHRAATGFRRGLSIVDNARPHVGKRVVMNVDIAGFFPNTNFWLIRRAIDIAMPKWISEPTRRLATDICAFGGVLPIGAPTSPAIANIVLLPVDRAISRVAIRNKLSYTRYADDITLSGDDPTHILPFIRDVIKGLGYELDSKKTNIFRRGRRQIVTGLVVNDKVSVPRSVRKRLRAAIHRVGCEQSSERLTWHQRTMSIQELQGRIAFTGVAHPNEAADLAKKLRNALFGS